MLHFKTKVSVVILYAVLVQCKINWQSEKLGNIVSLCDFPPRLCHYCDDIMLCLSVVTKGRSQHPRGEGSC